MPLATAYVAIGTTDWPILSVLVFLGHFVLFSSIRNTFIAKIDTLCVCMLKTIFDFPVLIFQKEVV